jgi:hypothetical protein
MFECSPTEGESVNCALPLPQERWQELNELAQLDGIKLNQYLPEDMHLLCDQIMQQYTGPQELTVESPYLQGYLFLRDGLQAHESAKLEPRLHVLNRPTGGWEMFKAKLAEAGIDLVDLEGLALEEEMDLGYF